MKNKAQNLIIIILLAIFVLPQFAFGQTSTFGITSANMSAVVAKENALNSALTSGNAANITSARLSAMQACVDLGNTAYQITKASGSGHLTNISTLWTDPNGPCIFGLWGAPVGGTDILARNGLRKDLVTPAIDPTITALRQNILGGKTLDQAAVDASNKAATGGALDTGSDTNAVSRVFGWVLTFIANVITTVLLALVALAGLILNWAMTQTNTTLQPQLLLSAWSVVRDFMNLFFILALIVIALATILRLEDKYNYRHLLPELILMALLINFSKVIADTLIGFSNFISQIFIPASGFVGFGQFFSGLVTQGKGASGLFISGTGGASEALGQGILKIITAAIAAVSFLAVAILLFVRVIGLWVLTVISPVAYALNILPATEHYAKEWWHAFIKYLVWAPVSLFFLRLAQGFIDIKGSGTLTTNSMFDFILISAFLWAAVIVAKESGMVGAELVLHTAEKVGHKAFETGDMFLARGAKSTSSTRRALSYLSVGAAQQGLALRLKKKEHESYNQAAAQRADQFSKVFSGGTDKTEFRKRAMVAEWQADKKLNLTSDEAELRHINDEGIATRNSLEVAGTALKMSEDGNLNGLVGGTTALHLQKYIDNLVEKKVMKKQDAYQLGQLMSNAAQENGQYNLAKAFVGDGHGGIRKTDDEERNAMLIAMGKKGNPQEHDRKDGRLATGFDIENEKVFDANGEKVLDPATKEQKTQPVIKDLMPHGEKAIENINSYNDHAQTGNKETKLFRMLGASQTTFKNNREAWAVEANEFLGKRPEQIEEAYKVADASKERVKGHERLDMVWNDNLNKAVVDPEHTQLKLNVEQLIKEKIIIPEEDFKEGKGRFRHLVKYAPPEYQRGAQSTNTRPPQNPPTPPTPPSNPTTPPPPGWTVSPGGIAMPPDNT